MLFATHTPKHFWGKTILIAAYLINRMPSCVLGFKTPCQTPLTAYPSTRLKSTLTPKVFGCTAFVHIHKQHHSKHNPKATKCVFLGYPPHQNGYKCYSLITKKFYNSMDVMLFEDQPYYPKTAVQGSILTMNTSFGKLKV